MTLKQGGEAIFSDLRKSLRLLPLFRVLLSISRLLLKYLRIREKLSRITPPLIWNAHEGSAIPVPCDLILVLF
ncbi:MAG: hypothetical protein ACJ8M1_00930 [Chthoniobacterales bacterium]